MTTSAPTNHTVAPDLVTGAFLLPWINRGLEALWLMAVILVPIVFLDRTYAVSEAQLSFVEVPKVAVLRMLAGVMVLLWIAEWSIKSSAFQRSSTRLLINESANNLKPIKLAKTLTAWLRVHPTRWLVLAAFICFGSTIISTILSGAISTSIWGEIPGQDSYSAYSVLSQAILFGVVATHLRSADQLGRLMGAIILMGFIVGLYGILQYSNYDVLNTGEGSRVTVFMGNPIFAAAVLSMTAPFTLIVAVLNFKNTIWSNWRLFSKLSRFGKDWIFTATWAFILATQLLGLMFTFSRGPWVGATLAITIFLSLTALTSGLRIFIKISLVLGLAGVFAIAFLHWTGMMTLINAGSWIAITLVILGLAGSLVVLYAIDHLSRRIIIMAIVGALITSVGVATITPLAFSDRSERDSTSSEIISDPTSSQVTERILSIPSDVFNGFAGGRRTHWAISWDLIKNRPWFEFESLSLPWIRPIVGYGPDLFTYTYLLKSPPDDVAFFPLSPDHAHNYFLHQTVEQGILGGLASIGIFLSVIGIGVHHIIRRRHFSNPMYQILLIGLLAIIFGRFLEMMVGVARISDLTILWLLFGIFASLIRFDKQQYDDPDSVSTPIMNRVGNRRGRKGAVKTSPTQSFSNGLFIRLAILAWVVGGLGVITWQKNINYVRGAVAEGEGLKHYQNGEIELSLEKLTKAIKLAPGIPSYYTNRSNIFDAYRLNSAVLSEPNCSQQIQTTYPVCLGLQSLESKLEAVRQQPLNFKARVELAVTQWNLNLLDESLDSYRIASTMVPNSWPLLDDFGEALVDVGMYEEALHHLERSLKITGFSPESTRVYYLMGRTLFEMKRFEESREALRMGLSLGYTSPTAQASLELIREINHKQGVTLNIGHFTDLIEANPEDAIAFYNRGLANLSLSNYHDAHLDIERAWGLGVGLTEVVANRGYAILKTGDSVGGQGYLYQGIEREPRNGLFNAYLGESHAYRGELLQSSIYLDNANSLNNNLGLVYLLRSQLFLSVGLVDSAKLVLEHSVEMPLPTVDHYIRRSEILTFLRQYDLALLDIDKTLRLNPNYAPSFSSRAGTYAIMGDFKSALSDLTIAIQHEPYNPDFRVRRGVIYHLLDEPYSAKNDFESGLSLGATSFPNPEERQQSYFDVYYNAENDFAESSLELRLKNDTEARELIVTEDALTRGYLYRELGMWQESVDQFSEIIRLTPSHTSEMYRHRGDAYLMLNLPYLALEDYSRAVDGPFDAMDFISIGTGLFRIGEIDNALTYYNEAINLQPKFGHAYKELGNLLLHQGKLDLALQHFERATEFSSLDDEAYFKLSSTLTMLGRQSSALENLQKAIYLAPTNPDYIYRRGVHHLESREYELALTDLDLAIALKKGFIPSLYQQHTGALIKRGQIRLIQGHAHKSIEDAQTAIDALNRNRESPEFSLQLDELNTQFTESYELIGDAYSVLGNATAAQSAYSSAADFR